MPISLYTFNLFEIGIATITGDPDMGYPEARLWDRCGAIYWKDTASGSYEFKVEQVGSDGFGYTDDDFGYTDDSFGYDGDLAEIDLLWVKGHNFIGRTCYWQYSDTGLSWTTQETWTQADSSPIVKTITPPAEHKFWRLYVASITNPVCGEIIMSKGAEFAVMGQPRPRKQAQANVSWNASIGGLDRSIKAGPAKNTWEYQVRIRSTDTLTFDQASAAFAAEMENLDEYSKPFLIKDIKGNYMLVRLLNEPPIEHDPPLSEYIDFNIKEVP